MLSILRFFSSFCTDFLFRCFYFPFVVFFFLLFFASHVFGFSFYRRRTGSDASTSTTERRSPSKGTPLRVSMMFRTRTRRPRGQDKIPLSPPSKIIFKCRALPFYLRVYLYPGIPGIEYTYALGYPAWGIHIRWGTRPRVIVCSGAPEYPIIPSLVVLVMLGRCEGSRWGTRHGAYIYTLGYPAWGIHLYAGVPGVGYTYTLRHPSTRVY